MTQPVVHSVLPFSEQFCRMDRRVRLANLVSERTHYKNLNNIIDCIRYFTYLNLNDFLEIKECVYKKESNNAKYF